MPARDYYLPNRQLVKQSTGELIEKANIPRSTFIGTKTRKTAFTAGKLVPFLVDEILPGDHMTYNVAAYIRMATPLFPIFDNQRVETFFFFTPSRILWTNWVKMMGEQASPGDTIAYLVPQINLAAGDLVENNIYDHFGIPINQLAGGESYDINALPLRAYARIYNDWFRDQNVMTPLSVLTNDGPDGAGNYVLANRAKSHDYFTSALPWTQKFTAPTVPISGYAPVTGLGVDSVNTAGNSLGGTWYDSANGAGFNIWPSTTYITSAGGGSGRLFGIKVDATTGYPEVVAAMGQTPGSGGYAAANIAINSFRQAIMIQSLLERDARGGTRYTELIRSHFGVVNPDFRLQRPEYIGGGSTPLNTTPIAQTAPTTGAVLGTLGGTATAAGTHRASYAATEHGYIIGLINVKSEISYQHGIHKLWTRRSRYDFYWPALAALGEQAILNQELYANGTDAQDTATFGYQERWHEYRTIYSDVTGLMRSLATGTLDAWHLAQRFAALPTLNTAFLIDDPPMTRVLAAGAAAVDQQYLADIQINRNAVRPIPTFGTPASLGRF